MLNSDHDVLAYIQSPVAVVCHDAGAANLLFSWLRYWVQQGAFKNHCFHVLLEGPASVAWSDYALTLPQVRMHKELKDALTGVQSVLTGTGWSSTLEHDTRRLAKLQQIPSIAVIDHWVNYQERFERGGEIVLPDAIWVADSYAADIAKELFRNVRIYELPNVYLSEVVRLIPSVSEKCQTLLYVLEPMRTDWGRGISGEFQALDFFIEHLRLIVDENSVHIALRPHPSDAPGKYDAWINNHPQLNIRLSKYTSLSESIEHARWVVGGETFALVVANAAGRKTYSSLPPWAHHCRLPHRGIVHLRDLIC